MTDRNEKSRRNTTTSPSQNMINWTNYYKVLDTWRTSDSTEKFQFTADLPTHSRITARTNVYITKTYIAKQSSIFNARSIPENFSCQRTQVL